MSQIDTISYENILEAVTFIENYLTNKNIIFQPTTGIICGTGLGLLSLSLEPLAPALSYHDIPHYPFSAIPGHEGRLLMGSLGSEHCIVLEGRAHLYQGFSAAETAFPIRMMKLLGVKQIITTNVAGAVNKDYKVGDFVFLKDHINFPGFSGRSALTGPNDPRFGPRFFPLVGGYSREMREVSEGVARDLEGSSHSHQGVYAMVGGPHLESVAEVNMLRRLAVDIVGMSTVPEVLAAVHTGINVLAISLVTNICLDHYDSVSGDVTDEILETVHKSKVSFLELVTKTVLKLQEMRKK